MNEDFGEAKGPNPLAPKREESKQKVEKRSSPPPPQTKVPGLVIGLSMLLIVLGLILVVALGFTFFLPDAPETRMDYGPYHFELDKEGSWRFDWQRGDKVFSVPLRFNPKAVENVSLQGSLNESFNRPEVYIAFDPTSGNFSTQAIATGELSLNMIRALSVTPLAACTKNETDACIAHC